MLKIFFTIPFIVTLLLGTVTSHGGHDEGPGTKNAIQDALLSYLCGVNGIPCNGHGSCSAGKCTCFQGYSGKLCEISDADIGSFGLDAGTSFPHNTSEFTLHDLIPHHFPESPLDQHSGPSIDHLLSDITEPPQILACLATDENACSGNGYCHEGSCLCQPGYSGVLCELSSKKGFCLTYKECAECTSFMIDCPKKCSLMANFELVFGFRNTEGETFRKCRFRNRTQNCTFYFKETDEIREGMKTIAVKACVYHQESTTNTSGTKEQLKDKPLTPVPSPQPTTSSPDSGSNIVANNDMSNIGTDSHDHAHDHDHGTMDGIGKHGKQDHSAGDSGSSFIKPESLLLIASLLILFHF